jgi:hypothetical protein
VQNTPFTLISYEVHPGRRRLMNGFTGGTNDRCVLFTDGGAFLSQGS